MSDPVTPCTKVCTLDRSGQICLGCGRTPSEIATWIHMGDAARRRVMDELPDRLARLEDPRSGANR